MAARGYAGEETRHAYQRIERLAEVDRVPENWAVLNGRCASHITRGELRQAELVARSFLQKAEAEGLRVEIATALRLLAISKFNSGDPGDARLLLEQALAKVGVIFRRSRTPNLVRITY